MLYFVSFYPCSVLNCCLVLQHLAKIEVLCILCFLGGLQITGAVTN